MPGFYPVDEYDLAGFTVGLLDKANIIDGNDINEDDVLIGIASSGIHSNGYSLVRKVFDISEENLKQYFDELGSTLGETLLIPTKIYVKAVLELVKNVKVKGISHITGGGFIENIPRMLPDGIKAVIEEGSWPVLPVFELLGEKGDIERISMYNTFNMGIGMVLAVSREDAEKTIDILEKQGEKAYVIGKTVKGDGIDICLR